MWGFGWLTLVVWKYICVVIVECVATSDAILTYIPDLGWEILLELELHNYFNFPVHDKLVWVWQVWHITFVVTSFLACSRLACSVYYSTSLEPMLLVP